MREPSDEEERQEMGHGVIPLWVRSITWWIDWLHLTCVRDSFGAVLFQSANQMCNQEMRREKGRGREGGGRTWVYRPVWLSARTGEQGNSDGPAGDKQARGGGENHRGPKPRLIMLSFPQVAEGQTRQREKKKRNEMQHKGDANTYRAVSGETASETENGCSVEG